LKDLLDAAVAGIEPRAGDPIDVVVRRGRRRDARGVLGVAVAALVVLLTMGFLAAQVTRRSGPAPGVIAEVGGRGSSAPPSGSAGPNVAGPNVAGRTVVMAGLRFTAPAGWSVRDAGQGCPRAHNDTPWYQDDGDPTSACVEFDAPEDQHRFVAIDVDPGNQINGIADTLDQPPYGSVALMPQRVLALPSGLSAWIVAGDDLDPAGTQAWTLSQITFPDRKIRLKAVMGAQERTAFLDTIQATHVVPGKLSLPTSATRAQLSVPGQPAANATTVYTTGVQAGADRVAQVLGLLRQQTQTVDPKKSCANGRQPVAQLVLRNGDSVAAVVTISSSGSCHEAFSSAGGAVQVRGDFLAQLVALIPQGVSR
jgi:hypothetical protein